MKALVATDGSEHAVEAAKAARGLLHDGVDIVLVTVVAPLQDPQSTAGGFEGPAFTEEEAEKWAAEDREAGRVALEHTAAEVTGSSTVQIVEGDDPGAALCKLALETSADVLVIGSSEKSWIRHLLAGSVMSHLVHHAPCPVLVVRHS